MITMKYLVAARPDFSHGFEQRSIFLAGTPE
jgi:hypothetical protein